MRITARTAMVLAVILIFTAVMFPLPAEAATSSYSNYEKAVDLKLLGLLANSPDNFDLGLAPTRVQGAVMLVRLLGKEELVKQSTYKHPFTDVPSWADCYIGYMYENQLTKGIGDSKFGTDLIMSAKQYVTFVLRSVGYYDKIDFDYDKALDKAIQIGLLEASEGTALKNKSTFLRDDMVGISYNALSVNLKASSQTLLDKLVNTDKAIFKPTAKVLGLYTTDLKAEFEGVDKNILPSGIYGSVAKNSHELFLLIRNALYSNDVQLKIDKSSYTGSITNEFEAAFERAQAAVTEITGVENFIKSWEYELYSNSNTFTVYLKYNYTKSEFSNKMANVKAALNKARDIVARNINVGMSDYDKEKKLHDYIVNNTRYDYENYLKGTLPDESFQAYGCLILGVAVCEAYSKAMKLMCDLSALECMIVRGKANRSITGEGHSWNIIKINGAYYHLDASNNDPISADGKNNLVYHYFNLPDSEMAKTNTWEKSDYPKCINFDYNYYYINNMVAANRADFEKILEESLELRKTVLELKINDYSKENYSNLSDILYNIMLKSSKVLEYNYSVNEEMGIIRIYNIRYS